MKLTEDLSLADKQAFAIEDCKAGRYLAITKAEGLDDEAVGLRAKDLPWIGDTLQIHFEETTEDSIQRLVYDRRNPDAGLQGIR